MTDTNPTRRDVLARALGATALAAACTLLLPLDAQARRKIIVDNQTTQTASLEVALTWADLNTNYITEAMCKNEGICFNMTDRSGQFSKAFGNVPPFSRSPRAELPSAIDDRKDLYSLGRGKGVGPTYSVTVEGCTATRRVMNFTDFGTNFVCTVPGPGGQPRHIFLKADWARIDGPKHHLEFTLYCADGSGPYAKQTRCGVVAGQPGGGPSLCKKYGYGGKSKHTQSCKDGPDETRTITCDPGFDTRVETRQGERILVDRQSSITLHGKGKWHGCKKGAVVASTTPAPTPAPAPSAPPTAGTLYSSMNTPDTGGCLVAGNTVVSQAFTSAITSFPTELAVRGLGKNQNPIGYAVKISVNGKLAFSHAFPNMVVRTTDSAVAFPIRQFPAPVNKGDKVLLSITPDKESGIVGIRTNDPNSPVSASFPCGGNMRLRFQVSGQATADATAF